MAKFYEKKVEDAAQGDHPFCMGENENKTWEELDEIANSHLGQDLTVEEDLGGGTFLVVFADGTKASLFPEEIGERV